MCPNRHPLSIEIPKHTKPTLAARTSSVRLAENHAVPTEVESTMVRRVRLGALETTRSTWPDIVSQVPIHRIGSPLLYPGGIPPTQKFWEFSPCWAHSFGGLPETPVIRRDNMSGLKNWAVLGSGHFRYRKLSPPVTSEGRFHPFLTHFLRGEPDSIF